MTEFPPPQPSRDILVHRIRLQQLGARLEACASRLRAAAPARHQEAWTPPQGQPTLPSDRRARRQPGIDKT